MINIHKYSKINFQDWNFFVQEARNGHFMFNRDYIEYHSDRFEDFSLMFYDQKNTLIAILPANITDNVVHSHQGLTFGGLVVSNETTTDLVHQIFLNLIEFLRKGGIKKFVYKRLPDFYTRYPAQEDLYALFLLNAVLFRRDVSTTIKQTVPLTYKKLRKRKIQKALKEKIIVQQSDDLTSFWTLLIDVLQEQHGIKPVHSLCEIETLKSKFPKNIKCFTTHSQDGGKVLAGIVIYETDEVAHAQYIASSLEGRDLGALDLLFDHLLKKEYKEKDYFDFGISNEQEGRYLNTGLISQKEGFGARAYVHDFYEIKIQ